jgi:acetyl esterase/lipase
LSPFPDKPDRPGCPTFEERKAVWPEHLEDIVSALRHLDTAYGIGSKYMLCGHSVGATLSLLAAIQAQDHGLATPKVILGISGIYDFSLLHQDHPEYKDMTFNAMKPGQETEASPALYSAAAYTNTSVVRVLLAHSRDDGLVPWNQVEGMENVFKGNEQDMLQIIELHGSHRAIWEEGQELARAIAVYFS